MTPQDIAALTALVALFEKIGTWPLITIAVLVVIGPWIAVFFLNRAQERRHAEVVEMYKSNVVLVDDYQKMHKQSDRREEVLIDLLRLNTEAQSNLLSWLRQRNRCIDLKGNGHECGA
ncbi:hypothetical protein [Geobacter sp.]|uniref:hypothetical protein n=1 Tax=Geobacter sp. TaxID=46610 RepID=UPI00261B6F8C|nr:hypothetical protein [Geobacter sp.]